MDTAQWPEGIGVVKPPMEGNSSGAVNNSNNSKAIITAGSSRPQIKPQAVNCPRCNSTHTKFCYYNNYSLSQPRYFCKTCRRYWTEGGSLRNVPVGGGSRKNKRSSSSSFLSKISKSSTNSQNPNNKIIFHEGQDLNLAYPPPSTGVTEFVEFPSSTTTTAAATTSSYHHIPEIFKTGSINGGIRGFSSFMSMINPALDSINATPVVYSSSSTVATSGQLPNFQEFSKSSGLDFSLDHHGLIGSTLDGVNHHLHHHQQESNVISNSHEKLFFPFEDLKQQPLLLNSSSTPELMEQQGIRVTESHHHQSSGPYWSINGSGLGGHGGASW